MPGVPAVPMRRIRGLAVAEQSQTAPAEVPRPTDRSRARRDPHVDPQGSALEVRVPPGGSLEMRVILVGRTGLDLRLRLESTVELSRARTPLEAIGELTQPLAKPSSLPCLIVVGDEVFSHQDSARDFVLAIGSVEERAVVVKVGPRGASSAPFHAVLTPDADLAELRRVLASGSRLVQPSVQPVPQSGSSVSPAAGTWLAESELLRAAAAGAIDDVSERALGLLRSRLREPDLGLEPSGTGQPVTSINRTFGVLTGARRTPPAELARGAEWLAEWLRLAHVQADLRRAVYVDDLTGAYNRRYFDRFLNESIESARQKREPLTILLFDLDNFKRYNDENGHATGDLILRDTVRLLRSVVRPTDRVCRVGGDEFVVIFHDPPREPGSKQPTDITALAERFQRQLGQHKFPMLAEGPKAHGGGLTISGGLATFPWDGSTPEELLAHADGLALESKRQGKNIIRFTPPPAD